MANGLITLKKKFQEFRKQSKSKGKGARYPESLRKLVYEEKKRGATFPELVEASGLSKSGVEKIVTQYRSGPGARRPVGRPKKEDTLAKSVVAKKGRGRPKKEHSETKSVTGKTTAKRGRGRPKKNASEVKPVGVKRGRGRPRKIDIEMVASNIKPTMAASKTKTTAARAKKTTAKLLSASSKMKAKNGRPNGDKNGLLGQLSKSGNIISIRVVDPKDNNKSLTLEASLHDFVKVVREAMKAS